MLKLSWCDIISAPKMLAADQEDQYLDYHSHLLVYSLTSCVET